MKTEIGYEKYLDYIKNTKTRRTVAKFRLSNHKLKIEKKDITKIRKMIKLTQIRTSYQQNAPAHSARTKWNPKSTF